MDRTVAANLSMLADQGRKARGLELPLALKAGTSTISRRAAAIGYRHKLAGHEPPTTSEAVHAVLRGIRRTIGSAKQGKRHRRHAEADASPPEDQIQPRHQKISSVISVLTTISDRA